MKKQLTQVYRPKGFADIVGQSDASKVVLGLIKNQTIMSRSLLLYGPSGTGKTSMARIISRHLNCESYDLAELLPCGKCDFCLAEKDPAVEEMDFGNTRGIDTVRSLIDSLEYQPQNKARVIILDECHHMTGAAATALLKAIEEPPEGVLFVLVTTDPGKLLPQLRNRCVKVPFGRVPAALVEKHLKEIATKEGVALPDYAFSYIAKACDGVMREALSHLEALMSIIRIDPTADLSNHHVLEEKLEVDGTSPVSLARLLIDGVYTGSYGKTLPTLVRILSSPTFSPRFFADRLYDYHTQTFSCLIDPKRVQKILFSDFYADWYATLEKQAASKALLLTVSSGEILFDLIMEMSDRLKNFEAEPAKLVSLYTTRMVRAVKGNAQDAYTKRSPFHSTYAKEHCRE